MTKRVVLTVRTLRHQSRIQRMLEAGHDARIGCVSGLDRGDAFAHGWIAAMRSGRQPARTMIGNETGKEGSQLNGNDVVIATRRPRTDAVHANASQATGSIIRRETWTSIADGLSLTSAAVVTVAGKEKDRCANTGLLRKGQLDVTFGIRSDNRQTA